MIVQHDHSCNDAHIHEYRGLKRSAAICDSFHFSRSWNRRGKRFNVSRSSDISRGEEERGSGRGAWTVRSDWSVWNIIKQRQHLSRYGKEPSLSTCDTGDSIFHLSAPQTQKGRIMETSLVTFAWLDARQWLHTTGRSAPRMRTH